VKKKKPPRAARPARIKLGARATIVAESARIELDARATIVQAVDLHRTLLERLASGQPIVVDGSRVEEIDTAILQLLASLWRTTRERGIACKWDGASDPLRRTASLVGLSEMLQFGDGKSAPDGVHAAA
jgi:anti-anti-sigma regulatory factor